MPFNELQKIIQQYNAVLIPVFSNKMDYWKSVLKFLLPEYNIIPFPEWDTDVYSLLSPSQDVIQQRLSALQQITSLEGTKNIVITPFSCLITKLPPKKSFLSNNISINVGDTIDREFLLMQLVENNFIRTDEVLSSGEFSVRGSIIDVSSNCGNFGYRLDFLGSTLENIKKFDISTQLSYGNEKSINISANNEVLITEQNKQQFYEKYEEQFGKLPEQNFQALESNIMFAGIEHYMPLFHNNTSSLTDYLPEKSAILLADNHEALLQNLYDEKIDFYNSNKDKLPILSPEYWFKDPNYFQTARHNFFSLSIENLAKQKHDYNLYRESIKQNCSPIDILKGISNERKIVIATHSEKSLQAIAAMLSARQMDFAEIEGIHKIKAPLNIANIDINKGFIINDVCIISEDELFGEKLTGVTKHSTDNHKAIEAINQIKPNDFIVHKSFGVGIFMGLETITVNETVHDFIKIVYQDGDKIYLPVENLDLISKYADENSVARLDKLGGVAWQKRQAIMKNKIKLAAEQIMKLAATRKSISVPVFSANEFYERFCSSFKFIETDDQLASIQAIEDDLQKGYPMDRLICGDVGFGKTEVAMRACCLVATSVHKAQVAVIVPTTLLCLQHFNNFKERFKDIPINIEMLCKMNTPATNKKIKQKLAEGKVDVVITTHGIFAKDMKFENLALAIIDEEQHFGVKQKERIKEIQNNVHLLTLSATPIPRTLQMSIAGIKELSLINTPPTNRKEIKTNILPFNKEIVANAIKAEYERNGRVFFVTPRISHIQEIQEFLDEYVPNIKYGIAHGKITSKKLEDTITSFYQGEISILISTNIIESGIDIPNANTLIVDRAELFGLSQLYQIRGRIGRGSIQAHAYITISKKFKFNTKVYERIEVFKSLAHFGGGLAVANHDSDLRGYGNLLGEEQSGHIKEVGVELYNQMLDEAMQNLSGEVIENWSPVINLGISIQIPATYVENERLRLSLYRKIANVAGDKELEQLQEEITDRFGEPPVEVKHLFDIIKVKLLSKEANVTKLDTGKGFIILTFHEVVEKHSERIFQFIKNNPQKVAVKPNNKIQFTTKTSTPAEKISSAIALLKSI